MKCCIVRDLLPGYLDELTSEETNEEVKKHLEDCAACRTVYEQMSAELRTKDLPEKKEIDFLRKLKIRIRQRYMFGAFLFCALLISVVSFLKAYDLPVSYDPERMTVELFQETYTTNDYGLMEWTSAYTLEPEAESVSGGDYDTRDRIHLVLKEGAGRFDSTSRGRTLRRDGESVRVVYYCYTRSLWERLFDAENNRGTSSSISTGMIYESNFFRISPENYQPKLREIYYLPMGNMNQLDRLSDKEFDAQRENAVLVWSGVI